MQNKKLYGHDDPANWKWKVLYYNKTDPRLFPPKRWGLGWTTNFANPRSILAMVALIVAVVALIQYVFVPLLKSISYN